jgi:large conductance mechanosensitive channel
MLKEFREFAVKGSMVELAVGIIIGTAFTAVVHSLVNDLVMPPIGMIAGDLDFSQLFLVLSQGDPTGPYKTVEEATKAGAVTLNYGVFVNTLVNFLIVGFAVFLMVKAVNRLRRQPEQQEEKPSAPTEEVKLLTEIRDALVSK